jgi:hypothetical protein
LIFSKALRSPGVKADVPKGDLSEAGRGGTSIRVEALRLRAVELFVRLSRGDGGGKADDENTLEEPCDLDLVIGIGRVNVMVLAVAVAEVVAVVAKTPGFPDVFRVLPPRDPVLVMAALRGVAGTVGVEGPSSKAIRGVGGTVRVFSMGLGDSIDESVLLRTERRRLALRVGGGCSAGSSPISSSSAIPGGCSVQKPLN